MFSFVPAYIMYAILVLVGLVGVVISDNLIKKVMSLNVFQVGILFFYISICYKSGLKPPVIDVLPGGIGYINPVPQVLMLTAIVVGLSISAVALALIVKISKLYNSISEESINSDIA